MVVHELLHILGVSHEQQRPDRDMFLDMHWENFKGMYASNMWRDQWDNDQEVVEVCKDGGLTDNMWRNFSDCISGNRVTSYGLSYDFQSIMHYSLTA